VINGQQATKIFPITERGVSADGVASVMITTGDVDREGDRIQAEGMSTEHYLRAGGPVFWAHDVKAIPVGKTRALTLLPGRGIRASFTWLEGDDFSARVKNAWDQGILGAASVGFRVLESVPNGAGGYDILRSELIEWSITGTPANPFATRTLKALGLVRGDASPVDSGEPKISCPRGVDCANQDKRWPCPALQACPIMGHAFSGVGQPPALGRVSYDPLAHVRGDETVFVFDDEDVATPAEAAAAFRTVAVEVLAEATSDAVARAVRYHTGKVD